MTAAHSLTPLSEVLTPDMEYIEVPEAREYRKLSVKLYGKGVSLDPPANGAALKMRRHQIAKSGQVILSEIWGKKGAVGFVPPEGEGALCTSHFFLFDINESRVERRWLDWIFRANYLEDQLDASAKGTTGYAAVRPKHLLACSVPLPTLAEQRRIVARIQEISDKLTEAQRLRGETMGMANAFVVSLHLTLAGSRVRKLGEVVSLEERTVAVTATGMYPQVGVRSFGGGLFPKRALSGTETTYGRFNRLFSDALVLSQVKAWEGAVAVCPKDLDGWFVSPEYRTFSFIPACARPRYLARLVRTEWFWSKLGAATRGVGARRERTRPEQFLEIEMPMPEEIQQQYGEQVFEKIRSLEPSQRETAAELDALMPAILDRAFKGEL